MNAMTVAKGLWILIKEIWIGISIHVWFDRVQNDSSLTRKVLLISVPMVVTVLGLFAKIRMHWPNKRLDTYSRGSSVEKRFEPHTRSFRFAFRVDWRKGGRYRHLCSFFESASEEAENLTSAEHLVPSNWDVTVPLLAKSSSREGTARKVT